MRHGGGQQVPPPPLLACCPLAEVLKVPSCLSLLRISRLFSDAKKILLYSQNSEKLDGFKEMFQALQLLQSSRPGG